MPRNIQYTPEEREFYAKVGANIRRARKIRGETLADLASATGVRMQQAQKWETGANCIPLHRLFDVAKHQGHKLSWYFVGTKHAETVAEKASG